MPELRRVIHAPAEAVSPPPASAERGLPSPVATGEGPGVRGSPPPPADLPAAFVSTDFDMLPEDWRVVRLGDVVQRTPQVDPTRNPEQPFRYVDVSSVSNESLRITGFVEHLGRDAPSRARKQVRQGDVIFATVRPALKRIAVVPQELDGQVCSTAFCVIRANREVADPLFLFYAAMMDSFVQRVSEHQRGSSYPAVTDTTVLSELIPLPPLPEQRAIARVLRTVQRAAEATDAVIAAARALKHSLMRHLFTYGPVPVDQADQVPLKDTAIGPMPENWRLVRLGEISRIGNGSTPKRTKPAYWNGGTIPWLTSAKVHETVIQRADEFVTELARLECHLPLVRKGSVVVAITGQGKTLGNAAIVKLDTCVSQHLAYIQFETRDVVPEFALVFLIQRYDDLRSVSQAGGSTKGALTCAFLKSYPMPLPPVEEQQLIVDLLNATDSKLRVEQARRRALDTLFRTLLHTLMTGAVRVPPDA